VCVCEFGRRNETFRALPGPPQNPQPVFSLTAGTVSVVSVTFTLHRCIYPHELMLRSSLRSDHKASVWLTLTRTHRILTALHKALH
jgi:hypothetical protein